MIVLRDCLLFLDLTRVVVVFILFSVSLFLLQYVCIMGTNLLVAVIAETIAGLIVLYYRSASFRISFNHTIHANKPEQDTIFL